MKLVVQDSLFIIYFIMRLAHIYLNFRYLEAISSSYEKFYLAN